MKPLLGTVVVAAALVALPSPLRAAMPQATMSADHNLDERIEKKIDTSSLKKFHIKVSVTNGVATLTGKVATEAERRKATQLATLPGIARVDNQLVVDQAAPTGTAGTLKKDAEKAADKTKEGLSKTGEVITDGWITTRVHSKFVGEDLLKDSDINVDTKDHVVTLKGTVMSAAGRARAVEQTKEVEGVHRVIDQLTIGPKK